MPQYVSLAESQYDYLYTTIINLLRACSELRTIRSLNSPQVFTYPHLIRAINRHPTLESAFLIGRFSNRRYVHLDREETSGPLRNCLNFYPKDYKPLSKIVCDIDFPDLRDVSHFLEMGLQVRRLLLYESQDENEASILTWVSSNHVANISEINISCCERNSKEIGSKLMSIAATPDVRLSRVIITTSSLPLHLNANYHSPTAHGDRIMKYLVESIFDVETQNGERSLACSFAQFEIGSQGVDEDPFDLPGMFREISSSSLSLVKTLDIMLPTTVRFPVVYDHMWNVVSDEVRFLPTHFIRLDAHSSLYH